jgi:signal transduction histidine kinase
VHFDRDGLEPLQMSQIPEEPERRDLPRRTILIVDDDPDSLRFVGRLLMEEGCQVHAAASGHAAIEIASTVRPDLILLDIRMSDLNGIDCCRALKASERTRAIPVIFLTGHADQPSLLEAFDAGGADYVVKPFEPRILLARVRAHAALGALSRGLEAALDKRTRELQDANDRLRRLATDVALLEETEKARLAGALHDGPMQKLAIARMQIESGVPGAMDAGPPRSRLAAGLAMMGEAIDDLRTLQFDLSPPVLHQRGLAAALDWLARSSGERNGLALNCVVDADLPPLGHELSVILFQCARELVNNLVKHAGARGGGIRLQAKDGVLTLSVEDDGHGFRTLPKDALPTDKGGFGLYSLRERMRLFDGSVDIASSETGSRVSLRLPLPVANPSPPADGQDADAGAPAA